MISALLLPKAKAPQSAARPRLHRAVAATRKRQRTRPAIEWSLFDDDKLRSCLNAEETNAFAFTLAQMHAFEAIAPRNLRILARATPIEDVRESYLAQIDDEIVHDAMFAKYRTLAGVDDVAPHFTTQLASNAAALIQRDAVVGAIGVTTGIEFFAVEIMRALSARIDEPLFLSLMAHIEVDERRHQVLAVEAVAALGRAELVRSVAAKARVKAGRAAVEMFFRQVICRSYQRHADVLGFDLRAIYETSLDNIADQFRRELPPAFLASI